MGRVLTFLSILALAACGAAPGTPTAQDKSDTKAAGEKSAFNADDVLPWDPAVRKGVLPNGLSYFIERNDHPKGRAELRLVVKVGSVVEDEDQLGLAHFVEHMAFNGSTNFSGNQLIDTMERFGMGFGAHLNAYTSFDETVYKLQIPTEPKLLDTGLLVLRDWAGGLTFDPKEVAKERGVVLDEWRRTRGARGRIRDALIPLQFKGSQYAKRLPIGTEKSLKTFTREQAVRFYRDWYRPDLMAVIVVGEFDVDKMEAQIKARFGDLKNPEKSRERIQFKIPAQDENLYGIITDPEISSSGVSMTQIVKQRKSRTVGEYKSTLVRSMALSMLNGRFRETARRKDRPFRGAYAYQSAMNPSYARQGIGATPYEGRTDIALKTALTELRRAQKFGFTASEFSRRKRSLISYFDRIFKERRTEKSKSAAGELIRHFTTGETVPGIGGERDLVRHLVPLITLGDINAYMAAFLGKKGRLLTVTMPKKTGLVPPTEEQLEKTVADVQNDSKLEAYQDVVAEGPLVKKAPQPGKVLSESKNDILGTIQWNLSNGVRVFIKPTDFEDNRVSFSSWRWGGDSLVSDDDYHSASTAGTLAGMSGVGPFNPITLPKRLVGKRAGARLSIDGLSVSLSGSAALADLDTMFELLWLRATKSRIDDDAFKRYQANSIERLRNRDANPSTEYNDTYRRLLWNNHFRMRPWTVETMAKVDLEKARGFLRSQTADWSGTTFVFVGKIDLKRLRPLVERWIGSLPGTPGKTHSFQDRGERAAKGVHVATVRRGLEPKAKVSIRISGDFKSVPKNRYAIRSLARVLSMRLREVLREDKGGTYSAGAGASMSFHPAQTYGITISFSCEPKRVEELTKAAWEIVESVKAKPVDVRYTQKVAAQQAREDEAEKRRNSYWQSVIMSNLNRKEPTEALVEYWSLHKTLTPKVIHDAAKQYLDTKRYVQMTLLPAEEEKK